MNIVYLSPHFPPNFKFFCFALREEGARVLGVGDATYWDVPDDLRGALTEYWHVADMYNRPAELQHAVEQLALRYGPIHRIDSNNEFWLALEADVREKLNIFGQRPKDLARNRSKIGMKAAFKSAGVPVAAAEIITSVEQAKQFIKKHGFPVVIKPDTGVGASGASKISTMEELDRALNPLPQNVVMEAFIKGRIITYDGLVDRDGRIVFETSHLYSSGIMEIVTERRPVHYYSLRELPPKLLAHGRNCVREFDIRERFFHFEFFLTDSGEYYALEVNVRPPGGYTTDMMNYSAEIDLYRAWARLLVNNDSKIGKYERKYFVAHVGRRSEAKYRRNVVEIMTQTKCAFIHHPPMPVLWRSVMGDDCFLVGHETEEGIQKAIDFIEEPA